MTSFITFVILACVAISGATKFEDCGEFTVGGVKSVEISGCPENLDSCILEGNPNKTVAIEFELDTPAEKVTVLKHDSDWSRRFDVAYQANTDACVDSGLTCPLAAGQSYTYTTSFVINYKLNNIDNNRLRFRWILLNQDEYEILCVRVPNKLKKVQ
ncbi:hypothetical protein JTE90_027504 [Oedothorax gibbosus]|uniref:MD-2-related lipid-recognition domain-containing protein n=1 Tax=Oedothorax gibbosus TaxID=931172 RepID=A0AAV6UBH4_9ARAC|nr:hypothetical protein JTE90_027504 [Oedothorax gibbosus]